MDNYLILAVSFFICALLLQYVLRPMADKMQTLASRKVLLVEEFQRLSNYELSVVMDNHIGEMSAETAFIMVSRDREPDNDIKSVLEKIAYSGCIHCRVPAQNYLKSLSEKVS